MLGPLWIYVIYEGACAYDNLSIHCSPVYSIKHEYGAWDDKNPTVQTCNANTKITPGSHTPQEVAPDAYVVFSYDVTFEVYFLLQCPVLLVLLFLLC